MQHTSETAKPAADAGNAPPDAVRKGLFKRMLLRFYDYRDSHREHPYLALVLAGFVLLVGFIANDAYTSVKGYIWKGEDHLATLAKEQKEAFADLKENLGQLRASIGNDGDRTLFSSVQNAVESMANTNAGLIQQLALSKRENAALSKASQQKGGVSGGYDFILAEDTGIRLDATTVLGMQTVNPNFVHVSLTALGAPEAVDETLRSGQSLAYQNASGQSCKVSLLSINDAEVGSASFANGCS